MCLGDEGGRTGEDLDSERCWPQTEIHENHEDCSLLLACWTGLETVSVLVSAAANADRNSLGPVSGIFAYLRNHD